MNAYTINKDPKAWIVVDNNQKLQLKFGGDDLLTVTYGYHGPEPMTIIMRKSVYNKCICGVYTVDPTYTNTLILIKNSGETVKQVHYGMIY